MELLIINLKEEELVNKTRDDKDRNLERKLKNAELQYSEELRHSSSLEEDIKERASSVKLEKDIEIKDEEIEKMKG